MGSLDVRSHYSGLVKYQIRRYVYILPILSIILLLYLGPHTFHLPSAIYTYFIGLPRRQESHQRTAIVSNLQNELYAPCAFVLAHTLKKHNPHLTSRWGTELILLLPRKNDITTSTLRKLEKFGWTIRYEDDIEVKNSETLAAHFRRNYIKLRVWSWIEYVKIAWIDADCVVMGDISLLLSNRFGKSIQTCYSTGHSL